MIGGTGNDTFAAANSNDTIDGGAGSDSLSSFNASDATIDLYIDSNETIDLRYGDTSISNLESIGSLTTGSGNDSIIYDASDSVGGKSVNGNAGDDFLTVDFSDYNSAVGNIRTNSIFELNNYTTDLLYYYGIEQFDITGSDFNDSLRGNDGNDSITAGKGNDSLLGSGGNDTLDGSAGNDFINSGSGNDSMIGGTGNDTFAAANSNDTIDGGAGSDSLSSFNASDATIDLYIDSNETIDLRYGDTSISNLESIGSLTTGSGNDSIIYDASDSVGGKSVNGNAGDDFLAVNFSDYTGAVGNTRTSNRFELNNNSTDLLYYYNIQQFDITGSSFGDLLGSNNGDDTINGRAGNDRIMTFDGNDRLIGGSGDDTLSGGTGQDSFVFDDIDAGIDYITDFSVDEDILVFSTAFDENLQNGSVSSGMFIMGITAANNEHRFIYDAGSGDLSYDSDGVGNSEQIKIAVLRTDLSLTHNNFLVEF